MSPVKIITCSQCQGNGKRFDGICPVCEGEGSGSEEELEANLGTFRKREWISFVETNSSRSSRRWPAEA